MFSSFVLEIKQTAGMHSWLFNLQNVAGFGVNLSACNNRVGNLFWKLRFFPVFSYCAVWTTSAGHIQFYIFDCYLSFFAVIYGKPCGRENGLNCCSYRIQNFVWSTLYLNLKDLFRSLLFSSPAQCTFSLCSQSSVEDIGGMTTSMIVCCLWWCFCSLDSVRYVVIFCLMFHCFLASTLCPVKNGPPRHHPIKMSNLNWYE